MYSHTYISENILRSSTDRAAAPGGLGPKSTISEPKLYKSSQIQLTLLSRGARTDVLNLLKDCDTLKINFL